MSLPMKVIEENLQTELLHEALTCLVNQEQNSSYASLGELAIKTRSESGIRAQAFKLMLKSQPEVYLAKFMYIIDNRMMSSDDRISMIDAIHILPMGEVTTFLLKLFRNSRSPALRAYTLEYLWKRYELVPSEELKFELTNLTKKGLQSSSSELVSVSLEVAKMSIVSKELLALVQRHVHDLRASAWDEPISTLASRTREVLLQN